MTSRHLRLVVDNMADHGQIVPKETSTIKGPVYFFDEVSFFQSRSSRFYVDPDLSIYVGLKSSKTRFPAPLSRYQLERDTSEGELLKQLVPSQYVDLGQIAGLIRDWEHGKVGCLQNGSNQNLFVVLGLNGTPYIVVVSTYIALSYCSLSCYRFRADTVWKGGSLFFSN